MMGNIPNAEATSWKKVVHANWMLCGEIQGSDIFITHQSQQAYLGVRRWLKA